MSSEVRASRSGPGLPRSGGAAYHSDPHPPSPSTAHPLRLHPRIRRALSRPIRAIKTRIRSGPNAGLKWSLSVSGRGIRDGNFESEKFDTLPELIRPGDTFWDVGAHYGYAALVGARKVGPSGRVIACEPSEMNRWFLRAHLDWNGFRDAAVLPVALTDTDGVESFGGTGGSTTYALGRGTEEVTVRSLSSLLAEGLPAPTMMKMDVEGAEVRVVKGLAEAIGSGALPAPLVMVATHDPTLFEETRDVLKGAGYTVVGAHVFTGWMAGTHGWIEDPDLLAIPEDRLGDLDRFRSLPLFRGGPLL